MIRHIVMWTVKDEVIDGRDREANIALMVQRLAELKGQIPGILTLEARRNENAKDRQPFDVVLFSELESWEALEAYQVHPAHEAVVDLIKRIRKDRAAVDYEVYTGDRSH